MQRHLIVWCCLLLLSAGAVSQAALARTQCETKIPGTQPAADKPDSGDEHATAAHARAADAKPAHAEESTAVTGVGSSAAGGGDDASTSLTGAATAGGRKHGLRWQSLLPGVIK